MDGIYSTVKTYYARLLNSYFGLAVFYAGNSEKNQVLIPVAICQERQRFLSIWKLHKSRHSYITSGY